VTGNMGTLAWVRHWQGTGRHVAGAAGKPAFFPHWACQLGNEGNGAGCRVLYMDKGASITMPCETACLGMARPSALVARWPSQLAPSLALSPQAAPEMLLGARCTEKADIYSLGK